MTAAQLHDGWRRDSPEPDNRARLVRYSTDPDGLQGIARHNGARWVFFWDDEEDDDYIIATWPKAIAWAFATDCAPMPTETEPDELANLERLAHAAIDAINGVRPEPSIREDSQSIVKLTEAREARQAKDRAASAARRANTKERTES